MTNENSRSPSGLRVAEPSVATVILCRQNVVWSVGLRRELAQTSCDLVELTGVALAWERLAELPTALLVVECTRGNLVTLLDHLRWTQRDFPLARVAVVGSRTVRKYRWTLLEFGALITIDSPRKLWQLTDALERHFEQLPSSIRPMREQIWARLPWAKWDTNNRTTDGANSGQPCTNRRR